MPKRAHGFGSRDRECGDVVERLGHLTHASERGRQALARAWDLNERGRTREAKDAIIDALRSLAREVDLADVARRTSGSSLEALPRHGHFATAHELVRDLDRAIASARALKRRLSLASVGSADDVRRALSSERDRISRASRPRPGRDPAWKDATNATTTWLLWSSAVESAAIRKGASSDVIRKTERIRKIMSRAFNHGEPVWMAADEVALVAKAEAGPRPRSPREELRRAVAAYYVHGPGKPRT